MAYRVHWGPDGNPIISCDTSAEAFEIAKQGNPFNGAGINRGKPTQSAVHAVNDPVAVVFAGINSKARALLKGLANHPAGVELTDALGEECETAPAGFGGVLGAVTKEAKKVGLTIDDFVTSQSKLDGQRRFRWLKPTKLLLERKNQLQ